jgi:RHS repeat-associated protein
VPAQVTVPAGQTQAPLPVGTLAYGQAGITASLNGSSASAGVNVVAPPVAVTALEPVTFVMTVGAVSTFTVRINAAQVADTEITLAASNPTVLQVPASVTVPAGASSATFTATGLAVGDSTITATANGTSQVSSIHVSPQPAAIASLLPTPLPLQQGATGSLEVTINVAQEAPTTITLANSAPEVATVPESVIIAAGAVAAQIPVTALTPGNTVITASVNATSATATVEVTPPPPVVAALTPETLSLAKGTPGTLRVTVSRAPNAVTPVALVSSDPAIASVPAQVNIPAGALFADFPVMPNAAGQASITASLNGGSAASTVTVGPAELVSLTLAPQAPARFVGETVTFGATGTMTDGTSEDFTSRVTWSSSVPAVATINAAGVASALGAGETTIRAAYTFTAAQTGQPVTIEQSTPLSVQIQFAITGFTPASGPVGTAVAISGVGFDPNLSGNQVKVNGEPAVIASGNATVLNVIVPPRATTGPITVTNFRGTVTSATPFTVQEREAFDITLAPAAIQVPPGGLGGTRIRLASTGLNPYPYAASVAISGLPAGVTATLDRATVALNQDAIVTFSAAAGASSGAFTITLTASGASGVTTQTVTKTLGIEVLAAGGTTVTGRVLHADDGAPFVGARIRLGSAHVFTDESGIYRFVNPPVLGDQVLLIDGNTNNTSQFEFPSGIAMPVMILAGQDNKVITSHIGRVDASKFTNVVPGQAASVTEADIPNFSLNIQSGQTIIGWDGQPVTKINVRKVSVDRLPIRPIPEGWDTRSVYLFYFFREGGGTPTTPIPVSLPNDLEALPGEQITLWYYDESPTPDPTSNQWRILGTGTVSQDGKTIVSDPGFGMPKFCCGAVWGGRSGGGNTGNNGGNGCGPSSPNPVDLASGNAMVFRPRPFGISKFMTLDPNCRYRSTDARPGLFGRGFSFTYDWFAEQVGLSVRVANPQGVQFMLAREADGIYRSRSGRSGSIEMEVTPTATGRTLRMADGTRYEFNAPGRLLAIQDVAGNRTTFELDALGLLFSMTDPAGKVYEFQTSGAGQAFRIDRITDPAGRFIQFTYDGSRNLIAYRDQGGNLTQFGYTGSRISQVTDPRTAVKTIEYDAAGRAVRETLPENAEERYAYTAVGSTVAETRYTDANANITTYRFNGLGFETQMVDALGRVTKTELDPVTNQVRRRIDPAGRVTQYFYNPRGDLIRIVDADNKETKIDYDARFRKATRIENALAHVAVMAYDPQGNLTSFTSAENETSTFTYTSRGQVETITDPLLRVTRFTYDVNGNLANSTNAADETVTRIYDTANRTIELVDSLNRTTRFTYDNLDRVTEVRDAANGLTKLAYDANDNLLSAHDQNNNPVERNVYDLRNRLKQRTDAKNRTSAYDYDGVGNLTRMTDRKGQVTQYTYDAINRLTRIQDHDGRATTYAYDLAGNLAQVSDTQSGEILMSYDVLDRLIEVVMPQGRIAYTYDAIGRRTSRTLSDGDVTTYTYDKVNRIKTVTLRGRTASYNYDVAGRLTERLLPNSLKVAYQYDDADRITSIAYRKTDDSLIEAVTYSYDNAGQRTSRGDGQVAPSDTTFSASYDEANRLTAITLNGEAFTLSYDDNGNLASKSGSASGTTTYTWNARDQLVGLSGSSGSATFKYDSFGRRIEKIVNAQTTGYVYDGVQAFAELKGSAIDTVYHTGISIDEVLARYAPLGNKTLLTDALMSVIAQANDDQSIANFYAYSAYGEAASLGPDGGNSLQYTGRENDGSGLYYYRARYYDPVLKRFISEDPITLAGGLNIYAYVGGGPTGFTDPYGEQKKSKVELIKEIIGAIGDLIESWQGGGGQSRQNQEQQHEQVQREQQGGSGSGGQQSGGSQGQGQGSKPKPPAPPPPPNNNSNSPKSPPPGNKQWIPFPKKKTNPFLNLPMNPGLPSISWPVNVPCWY